jgi:uncharacterized protein
MAEYRTPGVYIEEISTFPTSVVRVATAVPVFVGCTERYTYGGTDLRNTPTKIKSLGDYELMFGGEPTTTSGRSLNVALDSSFKPSTVTVGLTYYVYQSLRHFYANGGGDCYIVSIGDYSTTVTDSLINTGVDSLLKADEPTLILTPDAYGLAAVNLGNVQKHTLAHCNKMQDRFGIMDVKDTGNETADALSFRNEIGTSNLKYGGAYYPSLKTTLGPSGSIKVANLTLTGATLSPNGVPTGTGDDAIQLYIDAPADKAKLTTANGYVDYKTQYEGIPLATLVGAAGVVNAAHQDELKLRINKIKEVIDVIYGFGNATTYTASFVARYAPTIDGATGSALKTAVSELWKYEDGFRKVGAPATPVAGSNLTGVSYNGTAYASAPLYTLAPMATPPSDVFLVTTSIKDAVISARPGLLALFNTVNAILTSAGALLVGGLSDDQLFATSKIMAEIRDAVRGAGYTLPPSGAIAGIYATVDASRGVWKAPANISLSAVSEVKKMREDQLDDLNIDATGGKSINAIRFFRGQGILVYGARTLAGNDNEWRYVPVRRLFIMVEESVKKATEPFVFEPNDANTWQRVKGMIENFLLNLWREGALAGGVPKDAFFVKVGINQTMTAQDILEGKLIVEIGMAAVRPAEFIILKFMHKLQES